MTRSQRLAALAAGAILLVGIPVAGAHQVPPPDLGEPVVVGRTGPGPMSGPVPSPDSRATERTPTRSPSPGTTTRTSDEHEDEYDDEYDDEDAVVPTTGAEQPDGTDAGRTDTAQPVSPKSPFPAGRAADDDATPEATAGSDTSSSPSASASDDGDDDGDGGGDGGDDDSSGGDG